MKYTTVEGHSIERDGEYETRQGERVRVMGFAEAEGFPIIILFVPDQTGFSEYTDVSCSDGYCLPEDMELDEGRTRDHPNDLMRPWIEEKPIELIPLSEEKKAEARKIVDRMKTSNAWDDFPKGGSAGGSDDR